VPGADRLHLDGMRVQGRRAAHVEQGHLAELLGALGFADRAEAAREAALGRGEKTERAWKGTAGLGARSGKRKRW